MRAAGVIQLLVALLMMAAPAAAQPQSDPSYGPDCYEGAPRSDENLDCPLPLTTGDEWNPWDDDYRWGYTFRLTAVPARMGGIGLGVRYLPARRIAFELSGDVIGGLDTQGRRRTETPLSLDALLFFHRAPAVHGYVVSGLGHSFARVQYETPERVEAHRYWGLRLGGGVQLKGARELGWGIDLVGFLRRRVTSGAERYEFVDPNTGVGTNLSWGALLRFSGTYYPHD